jgi:hypothetical protein
MIDFKDISVVYCGFYTPIPRSEEEAKSNQEKGKVDFASILKSTKEVLPGAEFILSTDEGTVVDKEIEPELDLVVYSRPQQSLKLPVDIYPRVTGGFGYNWHQKVSELTLNYNKMIITAKRGVKAATRKYILRLRTDTLIQNPDFIHLFEDYQEKRDPNFSLTEKRVLTSSLFTIDSRKWKCYLHHNSDWFNFGLRNDIIDMWDIPLGEKISKVADPVFKKQLDIRVIPEVYSWASFLKKKLPKKYKGNEILLTDAEVEASHKYIFNNLIPIDSSPINFYSVKKGVSWLSHNSIYTFASFLTDFYGV